MLPSALIDSLTTIAPSVVTSRSPSTVTEPAAASLKVTPTSSTSSVKSSRLMVTLPPPTSSIVTLPPLAPRAVFPASATPPSIFTWRPAIAIRSAANAAPALASTAPPAPIAKQGVSHALPLLMAALIESAFSRLPATAPNSPPTFTCALEPNTMPFGLTTQTFPPLFPLMMPLISDFVAPPTRLKRVEPDWLNRKFARSPCTRLNCDQSSTPPRDTCWIVVTPVAVPPPVVIIVPNEPVCPVTCATSSASACSGP